MQHSPSSRSRVKERLRQHLQEWLDLVLAVRRRDQRLLPGVPVVGHGLNDRIFARKIAVDRARAQARLLHDILHGRAVKTLARKAIAGGLDDLLAARIAMRLAYFRHIASVLLLEDRALPRIDLGIGYMIELEIRAYAGHRGAYSEPDTRANRYP